MEKEPNKWLSKFSKWYHGELTGWYEKLVFFVIVGFWLSIFGAFIIWLLIK